MRSLKITSVEPVSGLRLRLTLSDGSVVERDVDALIEGPIFEAIRENRALFESARAEGGTVVWPNGADLCPDVLIWGGLPPPDPSATPPDTLVLRSD
jgi:hypothetical protein